MPPRAFVESRLPSSFRDARTTTPTSADPARLQRDPRSLAPPHPNGTEAPMRSTPLSLSLLTLASLLPLAEASATEWTVAADGSGQFTQVQPAVDAAQSGDIIWVLPGRYGKVTIFQKALSVIGAGVETTCVDSMRIDSAPPGFANLSGLTILQNMAITTNQGAVVLRDCAGQDLALTNCQQVFVENWHGRRGTSDTVDSLWIASSHFEGTAGKNAVSSGVPGVWSQLPTAGSSAFGARASRVFVTGSEFTGGKGGQGSCLHSLGLLAGAPGGSGLEDESGACSFWIAASTFTPGQGGAGGAFCGNAPGSLGVKTKAATQLLWDAHGADLFPLSILTPSLIGQHTTIKISGHPGDKILLMIATQPDTVVNSLVSGFPLGLSLNFGHVTLGPLTRTVDLNGSVTWTHKIPDEPLLLGTPVFVQALLVAPAAAPQHPPLLTGVSVSLISE
jgi:hypothetical protein